MLCWGWQLAMRLAPAWNSSGWGTFSPITDMVGGGPFHLKATQWTHDTSMAVCLAESLIDGEQAIPEAWRSRLAYRELIERYAEQLCALARPT